MKILNNMHFELNWIEFQFNDEKWDANWWRKYWKFACKYSVEKKLQNNTNLKRHISMPLYLGMG